MATVTLSQSDLEKLKKKFGKNEAELQQAFDYAKQINSNLSYNSRLTVEKAGDEIPFPMKVTPIDPVSKETFEYKEEMRDPYYGMYTEGMDIDIKSDGIVNKNFSHRRLATETAITYEVKNFNWIVITQKIKSGNKTELVQTVKIKNMLVSNLLRLLRGQS